MKGRRAHWEAAAVIVLAALFVLGCAAVIWSVTSLRDHDVRIDQRVCHAEMQDRAIDILITREAHLKVQVPPLPAGTCS